MIQEPDKIQNRSFEIIHGELAKNNISVDEDKLPIVTRVIHTTADFDYAGTLKFSGNVVEKAKAVIRSGCDIVTDTQMAKSGINKKLLKGFDMDVHCYISDDDVAEESARRGVTRSFISMEKSTKIVKPCIYAIGNAPTALISLKELIEIGRLTPAMIIGVPVGFVNVVESKELIMQTCEEMNIPYIVNAGRKGGSNVAAAICNALMLLGKEE